MKALLRPEATISENNPFDRWFCAASYAVPAFAILICRVLERMRTNRPEAFSDGAVAVIITIMVLELKVWHGEPTRRREVESRRRCTGEDEYVD